MQFDFFPLKARSGKNIFVSSVSVPCGEASEVCADLEQIDSNEFFTNGSDGVYFVRVFGDSMEAEISDGDLLVVNRNLPAKDGDKILASINESYTVKIFRERPTLQLVASNGKYTPRKITRKDNFEIVGVVTHIIKKI